LLEQEQISSHSNSCQSLWTAFARQCATMQPLIASFVLGTTRRANWRGS
jgi:hypothetical protein